jgi:hypothetical protein
MSLSSASPAAGLRSLLGVVASQCLQVRRLQQLTKPLS